jgi:GPH family glycoside/pentoside/hexuronide:cation symporter
METGRLPVRVKLGYGICDLGGNLFFTVMAFILMNFLTDTVGLAAGLAGIAIMIGKFWDAVTDPLAGFLSDRTTHRWGRRRPWIFYGSFPLAITMFLMFTNPVLSSQMLLFLWASIAFCLLCTAYTAVNIPYNSLTPELTQDYHERTSLNGYRFGFAVIGTLMGAGAALPLVNSFADKNTGYAVMGAVFGAAMLITALVTFFTVREPIVERTVSEMGFFTTYGKVFKNRPYVLILLTYAIHVMGLTVVSSTIIYYFKYIHRNEAVTTAAMLILLVTAMLFIPVSVMLSKKIGKKAVYSAGLLILAAGVMVISLLGHLYPISFSLAVMAVSGIGMGFTYALPYAIVPDAVEYDYLVTGERREGAFYGIWTFALKIGQAVSLGIVGGVLSLSGYVPDAPQGVLSQLGIRLLIGPIPATILVISAIVLYFYPITEERYAEICRDIKEMEARKGKTA